MVQVGEKKTTPWKILDEEESKFITDRLLEHSEDGSIARQAAIEVLQKIIAQKEQDAQASQETGAENPCIYCVILQESIRLIEKKSSRDVSLGERIQRTIQHLKNQEMELLLTAIHNPGEKLEVEKKMLAEDLKSPKSKDYLSSKAPSQVVEDRPPISNQFSEKSQMGDPAQAAQEQLQRAGYRY